MESYFQDHMPGNVCFGCGKEHPEGLQIKSFWQEGTGVCHWQPIEKYHGWANLLNGGILATLVDCHCMCTAMAHAYLLENRSLDTKPVYRYATGTLTVKYLKPTSTLHLVTLRATIEEVKQKRTNLYCEVFSQGVKTAEAHVVAIRVFDSSVPQTNNPFVG